MTLEKIERLIRLVERRDLAHFEYTQGATTIRLRLNTGKSAALPAPATTGSVHQPVSPAVTSPAAGHFRTIHPLSTERFVPEGSVVRQGQTVAFLQVGPCLRPVTASADGLLGAALAGEGALVGYGTRLFALD